jgi:hypothetical protein
MIKKNAGLKMMKSMEKVKKCDHYIDIWNTAWLLHWGTHFFHIMCEKNVRFYIYILTE